MGQPITIFTNVKQVDVRRSLALVLIRVKPLRPRFRIVGCVRHNPFGAFIRATDDWLVLLHQCYGVTVVWRYGV